ncbi:MAG: cold shock domain-containing protein [Tabrizicola sp.]|nr:cold shock domain-containing protein [Tabrizicola sp.]
MSEEEVATQEMRGRVKWFDPSKGFGFVISEDCDVDILLHVNVLRNFGQSSVADGAGVTLRVQRTPRGVQAVQVLTIEAPEGGTMASGEEQRSMIGEEVLALPLEPARIKWYDKGKGFGFANVFGRSEDVFVHVEVLRASGFADLDAGEAIALRIVDGKRGRMAVQVLSWDAAIRDRE